MAKVTEGDREVARWISYLVTLSGAEEAKVCHRLAAYRESCVAEATTVCVKNWNEQTCRFWIALIEGQLRSIGCKPDIDNETLAVQMARDERDRERAAREKAEGELEQMRVQLAGCGVAAYGGTKDPAKCGDYGWSDSYQATLNLRLKHDALEARLRAVIEALRAVHGECPGWIEVCGSAHDPRCDGTCSVGCPVPVREQEKCQLCDLLGRDAQASPEPEASKHGGRDGE